MANLKKPDITIPENFEEGYLSLIKKIFGMKEWTDVKRVVMTGPPGSGKSTSLRLLEKKGFGVNPDISREYLAWRNRTGTKVTKKELYSPDMQKKLFYLMAKNEFEITPAKFVLMDYALPCNLAFLKLAGLKIPSEIYRSARLFRYRRVFIFEPLKIVDDGVRTENANDQAILFKYLKEVYTELNYQPVIVKKESIEERDIFLREQLKIVKTSNI